MNEYVLMNVSNKLLSDKKRQENVKNIVFVHICRKDCDDELKVEPYTPQENDFSSVFVALWSIKDKNVAIIQHVLAYD